MSHPGDISITNYTYHLPEERIAKQPAAIRDQSKLLVSKNGNFTTRIFKDLPEVLPANSLMVFNDTRVINARLVFTKPSGGKLEIFCLEPAEEFIPYEQVMTATSRLRYKCYIGGAAKWKSGNIAKEILINQNRVMLTAGLVSREPDHFIVEFSWQPAEYSFAEVLEAAGQVPLPPYIKRKTESMDNQRYQTIYAAHDGSVAAPTAGLHFTTEVMKNLSGKNIETCNLTLHVGAGTFKPVTAGTLQEHNMHAEFIEVSLAAIEKILAYTGSITAVGTTSLRTLETLYWLGVKSGALNAGHLELSQWEVYTENIGGVNITAQAALEQLIAWMKQNNLQKIIAKTSLLIAPGYVFRIVNRLVTNFHQPNSTLLLLVAAAMGDDWKKMYEYALENDFRFLSYGDSNLVFMAE